MTTDYFLKSQKNSLFIQSLFKEFQIKSTPTWQMKISPRLKRAYKDCSWSISLRHTDELTFKSLEIGAGGAATHVETVLKSMILENYPESQTAQILREELGLNTLELKASCLQRDSLPVILHTALRKYCSSSDCAFWWNFIHNLSSCDRVYLWDCVHKNLTDLKDNSSKAEVMLAIKKGFDFALRSCSIMYTCVILRGNRELDQLLEEKKKEMPLYDFSEIGTLSANEIESREKLLSMGACAIGYLSEETLSSLADCLTKEN